MRTTTIQRSTLSRRALSLAALAAAALTAACSDAATAPAVGGAGGGSQQMRPALGGPANGGPVANVPATLLVAGKLSGTPLAGTKVQFKTVTAAGTVSTLVVGDNQSADDDKRDGYYKVYLPAGASSYLASLASAPPEPYHTFGAYAYGAQPTGSIAFGTIQLVTKPTLRVSMLSKTKAPAPGATITITNRLIVFGQPSWQVTITDGGAGDVGPNGEAPTADGVMLYRLPEAGQYEVCERVAPTGFLMAASQCQVVSPAWDEQRNATFFHDTGIIAAPSPM
jgi:hypothetical protein